MFMSIVILLGNKLHHIIGEGLKPFLTVFEMSILHFHLYDLMKAYMLKLSVRKTG